MLFLTLLFGAIGILVEQLDAMSGSTTNFDSIGGSSGSGNEVLPEKGENKRSRSYVHGRQCRQNKGGELHKCIFLRTVQVLELV